MKKKNFSCRDCVYLQKRNNKFFCVSWSCYTTLKSIKFKEDFDLNRLCIPHSRLLENEINLLKIIYGKPLSGIPENSIQNFQEKIWKNGLNSVTLKQLDNIINDIQNGQIQSKFGRLNRYGRPCNSSIAIRAAIIARGEEGADYPQPSGKQNAQTSNFGKTRITRQKELLTEFAKLSGCWITDFYEQPESFVILNGKTYKYLDEGYENRVYDSEDKTEGRKVLKIIDIDEDWTHLFYSDVSEIFERIVIHNCFFNNAALNIVGFTNDDGVLKVIVEQLFFKGDPPTATEIETYIKNKINDIQPILDFYHNSDFYIGDFHDRNVIKDKMGNIIVIDCMLAFKDNGLGDLPVYFPACYYKPPTHIYIGKKKKFKNKPVYVVFYNEESGGGWFHDGDISVYYYENYREPNPDKLDIHGSVLRYCIHDATINDIRPISPLFDNEIKLLKLIYN